MARRVRTGIIGDDHPEIDGYAAIRAALVHSASVLQLEVETVRLPTPALDGEIEDTLSQYDALWCGPWGPYVNTKGAMRAIRYARESKVPFLGTCAGFQHAVIEYARSVLGLSQADHAESNPGADPSVIARLTHPLLERTAAIVLDPMSRTSRIYRRTSAAEKYRCAYGLNPEFLAPLHSGGLRVTGVNETGGATIVEFPDHPFFLATLFLPELTSRPAAPHPLITAFLRTAAEIAGMRA
ncbi:MAG: hypothetical protein H7Z40_03525 [Phycisphaerae bacterium]|nr:hypothetical protein [Gemmatimonadaceae bacterium]